MTILANDLRTKGVGIIKEALKVANEAVIAVRGKAEYVVMDKQRYDELQQMELDLAYLETLRDIEKGDYVECDVAEHIKELKDAL